ncbi:hypothetical protein C2G38_337013 [Gigaspora rosea]|uniref:Ion transport domain-containing protein n=1 Tax=Gigaspora rosea TaxID=44941 RepID=A0A397UN96_9GLOM|nr:hypothetical protein C2G38_337013 [Gigaspora rosea]
MEFRQFVHKPRYYFNSLWNWFDTVAILFPTIVSLMWLYNEALSANIIAITIFFLEIKFILFFRALTIVGEYFAIIIDVIKQVFSFFFLFYV